MKLFQYLPTFRYQIIIFTIVDNFEETGINVDNCLFFNQLGSEQNGRGFDGPREIYAVRIQFCPLGELK